MFEYQAKVLKVIDGDTVDLTIDLGFHITTTIRTRLLGINAPEVSTAEGRDARDKLRANLTGSVIASTYKDPGDKYGRWLAKLQHPTMGDVAQWMLSQGLARSYDGGAKP